jgi:multicomponent Na+:H+ antiporter subunit E
VSGSTGAPAGPVGTPRAGRVLRFTGWYVGRFLRASYEVAREIVTPGSGLAPVIVEVRLRCRTPVEITSFMSLITLTPGTMALSLAADRSSLVVHGMHGGDPDTFEVDLLDLEHRMLNAWRTDGAGPPPGQATRS